MLLLSLIDAIYFPNTICNTNTLFSLGQVKLFKAYLKLVDEHRFKVWVKI